MVAKRFFYVCAGLLCLTLAYHLGARSATAQAPGNAVVAATGDFVFAANGDAYQRVLRSPSISSATKDYDVTFHWALVGNALRGSAPATQNK